MLSATAGISPVVGIAAGVRTTTGVAAGCSSALTAGILDTA